MSYYLAASLVTLRAQVDAMWPNRSKQYDGWIGDTRHSALVSDHNPDYSAAGVVRAIDVTSSGINASALMKTVKGDPRAEYVIHKGKIYGRTSWRARKYRGSNPHTHHVHVSIRHTSAAENGHSWALGNPATPSKPAPSKRAPATKENKSIQRALRKMGLYSGAIDGRNESWQISAVKAFQAWHGLVPDGSWGPKTQAVFSLNKRVQAALKKQGYTRQVIDGYYGDKQTAPNVGDFQRRVGLKVDKIAGPDTLKALGL